MRLSACLGWVAVVALLAACEVSPLGGGGGGGSPPPGEVAMVRDHDSFVDALRLRGLSVTTLGPVQQPFFQPPGINLGVRGGGISGQAEVQSYTYASAAAAAADAGQIGPDGSPPNLQILWAAPPHFYLRDRLIVLYVGEDPVVTQTLTDLLGPKFAGY